MSKIDDINAYVDAASTFVPVDWVPIAASADALARPVRALRAEGAGTVTVNTAGGSNRVLNFKDGETRYGIFTHVTAITGPTAVEGGV